MFRTSLSSAICVFRQFHSVDDSAEEIHAAEIDLESLDAEPLESLDGNQQNFNIGRLSGAAVVFDSDLRKFPLPSAFRFLEPQHLAGVEQPDRFRRRREPRGDGLRNQRGEFRPKREDVAFAIDESIDLFFVAVPMPLTKTS